MPKHPLDTDIFLTMVVLLLVLLGLASFIIYFIVLYRKKQILSQIELEKANIQFQQELLRSQTEIQEQTLQTIGADLHDNIGQLLSLTAFTLKSVTAANLEQSLNKVENATELVGQSIKELRSLGRLLIAEQVMSHGLEAAFSQEVQRLEKLERFQVYFEVNGKPAHINPEKDLIIFRIIQEAFNNLIKHAEPGYVLIRLEYLPESIALTISDDGRGFDQQQVPDGMGLFSIRRRVALLNGNASIETAPGSGTTLQLNIPYP